MTEVSISGAHFGHCGYCGGKGSATYGVIAELVRARDYQRLMDRGFRRCGKYYYKYGSDSCCLAFTIIN
jgi:arginine-tRNA-protein transferase